jgi:hypothetical protein
VAAVVLLGHGYFFHYYEGTPNPNETSRLYLTMAVVDHGTLAIDAPLGRHGGTGDKAEHEGKTYCDKAPGLSFLAIPFYAVAQGIAKIFGGELTLSQAHLVSRWGAVILPTILLCYYLYLFLWEILPSWRLRILLVLVYAMASLARTYGVLFFSHQTAAVFSVGGIMFLYRLAAKSGWRGTASALLGGLFLGIAFATEYPTFIVAAVGAVLALFTVRPWWRLPLVALGVAIPVGLCLLYNYAAFDNPFSPGYSHLTSSFAAIHAKGLFGVTTPKPEALFGSFLSIERGLFFFSPWLVAALPGFYFLFRQREYRLLFWVSLAVLLGYAYFISSFGYWVGGDTAGPRHLTPLVPFLVFPVAALMERVSRSSWEAPRFLLSGLFVYSILLVNLVSMTFSYFHPELRNPFRDLSLEFWRGQAFPDSLGTLLGTSHTVSVVPYLLGLMGLALFACVAWPRAELPRRVTRRTLSIAYALGLATLSLILVLSLRPEGRTQWASHEVYRYMHTFKSSSPRFRDAGPPTRAGLILRGNNAVLVDNPQDALRNYREAQRAP